MDLFDVHWIPRHGLPRIFPVGVEDAWTDSFLESSTQGVECKAFVHIDVSVDAQMVSRGNHYGLWLEDCVLQLFLNLS